MELSPGDRVDRYVVEARLGEGGMAVVYRVRHVELTTLHALKVLSLAGDDLAERTMQEGRIQASIRHDNLVAVTDALRIGGAPALVLEYVDGPTLQRLIAHYPPHLAQIDDLVHGILAGVAHAHAKGLVHRDLKPANVLISTTSKKLLPKVADFGLAKAVDESLRRTGLATRTGISLGTPAWMAPEQFTDAKAVDARADVFALGAILYALVTGTGPFGGDNPIALHDAMMAKAWRPVHEWSPSVPGRWERAIGAALEPDPANRPKDVAELVALWDGDGARPWTPSEEVWERAHVERVRALGSGPAPDAPPPVEGAASRTLEAGPLPPAPPPAPAPAARAPASAPSNAGRTVAVALVAAAFGAGFATIALWAVWLATR